MTEQPVLDVPGEREIRDELQRLVLADLHGPLGGDDEEFTGENPIDRYPLGRLAPRGEVLEPDDQDELAAADAGDASEADLEPSAPNVPSLNPSALGFTAHVDGHATELRVTGKWARYEFTASEREETLGKRMWRRMQQGGTVRLRLAEGPLSPKAPDPEQPDVVVRGRCRRHNGNWLVSLFLENRQSEPSRRRHAPSWIFQVRLSASGGDDRPVFLPRPERRSGGDHDDAAERQRLAMAYRFHPEFAVGSGVAVHADVAEDNPLRATEIHTRTVPDYEIPATDVPSADTDPDLAELADLELDMQRLAELAETSVDSLVAALRPLVDGYCGWIERKTADIDRSSEYLSDYADQARDNLRVAARAADRIAAGIDLLAQDDDTARRAFGFANRAMYLQRLHTQVAAKRREDPHRSLDDTVSEVDAAGRQRWRPFQLAFILLNLPSLADPCHPERSEDRKQAIADLLWFPTGGGKTEAYLGLTAFTIAVRRLQPRYGDLDAGAGIAVVMRYTLRLLTIQQFERATTLICAAEVLRGIEPESGHSLKMIERGTTGEAANIFVSCDECGVSRPMSEAFGEAAELSLPACRGRHPHLGAFEPCDRSTRTLVLGATNSWFPLQLRAFTLPRDRNPLDHLIAEFWRNLEPLAGLPEPTAKQLMPTQTCWPELEPYGVDRVWLAIRSRAASGGSAPERPDELDLLAPEWDALTSITPVNLPDFTTQHEPVPASARPWLQRVVLVSRLREVAALYGFTRIDAPEWEVQDTPDSRRAPVSATEPTWVPCAEMRGEGVFLRFDETRVAEWERSASARQRGRDTLIPAHRAWCEQRRMDAGQWPGLRYILLHTFAHALIRELALDSGYSAAGIGERIYARGGAEPGRCAALHGGSGQRGHARRAGLAGSQRPARSAHRPCAGSRPVVQLRPAVRRTRSTGTRAALWRGLSRLSLRRGDVL